MLLMIHIFREQRLVILHIFLCKQIVNNATVDLEDVRMYRNAIRSRCEMVSVNFSDLDLLKSVQKSKPAKFGLSLPGMQ